MLETHTQYSQKLNVWAGTLNNTLIDSFFIDESLNAAKYEDMLKNEILPAIRRIVGDNFAYTWFQQDGAGSHYSSIAIPVLTRELRGVCGARGNLRGEGYDVTREGGLLGLALQWRGKGNPSYHSGENA